MPANSRWGSIHVVPPSTVRWRPTDGLNAHALFGSVGWTTRLTTPDNRPRCPAILSAIRHVDAYLLHAGPQSSSKAVWRTAISGCSHVALARHAPGANRELRLLRVGARWLARLWPSAF